MAVDFWVVLWFRAQFREWTWMDQQWRLYGNSVAFRLSWLTLILDKAEYKAAEGLCTSGSHCTQFFSFLLQLGWLKILKNLYLNSGSLPQSVLWLKYLDFCWLRNKLKFSFSLSLILWSIKWKTKVECELQIYEFHSPLQKHSAVFAAQFAAASAFQNYGNFWFENPCTFLSYRSTSASFKAKVHVKLCTGGLRKQQVSPDAEQW